MAKKFGKFLAFSIFAGAAAAGTYYYLKKKQDAPLEDMDDYDDYDDFNEDLDEDFDEQPSPSNKNRSYVSLDLDSAKEAISEKVIETIDKAKEKIEEFNVSEKLDKAKEKIEELSGTESKHSDIIDSTATEAKNDVSEQTVADSPEPSNTFETEQKDTTPSGFGHVEEFFNDNDEE